MRYLVASVVLAFFAWQVAAPAVANIEARAAQIQSF